MSGILMKIYNNVRWGWRGRERPPGINVQQRQKGLRSKAAKDRWWPVVMAPGEGPVQAIVELHMPVWQEILGETDLVVFSLPLEAILYLEVSNALTEVAAPRGANRELVINKSRVVDSAALQIGKLGGTPVLLAIGGGIPYALITPSRFADSVHKSLLAINIPETAKNLTAFEDLYTTDETRVVLKDLKFFLGHEEWFTKRRIAYHRAYLFYGPPGNGKTTAVRAISNTLGEIRHETFDFTRRMDAPDTDFQTWALGERGMGQGIALRSLVTPATRQLQELQTKERPIWRLLVLEDLDRLYPRGENASRNPVSLSCVLNCLDGIIAMDRTIIIATANRPEDIENSVLIRPGRFHRRIHFACPTQEQGADFLVWLTRDTDKLEYPGCLDVTRQLGEQTYAYYKGLYVAAACVAFNQGRSTVTYEDLRTAAAQEGPQQYLRAQKQAAGFSVPDRREFQRTGME